MESVPSATNGTVVKVAQREDIPGVGIAPAVPAFLDERLVIGNDARHHWYSVPANTRA